MSNEMTVSDNDVTVLEWVIPRPTGRWHQAIVVTSRHVWITPELTFADNERMTAAAAGGLSEFHEYLKAVGWTAKPDRCALGDVRGINWNETTGWMRIAGQDDHVIGAMIPNREAGNKLKIELKRAIGVRVMHKNKA